MKRFIVLYARNYIGRMLLLLVFNFVFFGIIVEVGGVSLGWLMILTGVWSACCFLITCVSENRTAIILITESIKWKEAMVDSEVDDG